MDIQSEIINNIDSEGYDDFTKIRWIYLYVCRLFSYDLRFPYANQDLKKQIYNKELDIKNVEEFEIVCYTFARVLQDILALFGFKSEIVRKDLSTFTHTHVIVKCNDYFIKLDPTTRHDVTRVKMNSSTLDFLPTENIPGFNEMLSEADKIIKSNYEEIDPYIKYDNETILTLLNVIEESAIERKLSDSELFFEKIHYLFSLINTRTDFNRYDDIDYYFGYLITKFKLNEKKAIVNGKEVTKKVARIKPAIFFKKDDNNMKDIINISFIDYENMPPIFYLLKKDGDNFKAREIFKEEALEILDEYETPIPYHQYIFKEAAQKLSSKEKNGIII